MPIYPKKRNVRFYRKLWEQHHGRPIPTDKFGRSYDIHHIDGDYTNNSIENLYACPIQEHYDIHFKQEDWRACVLIARRMKMSPELLSELARKAALKRVSEGTHPFLGSDLQQKRLEDGTHNFLNPMFITNNKERLTKLVIDGTHNFLGPETNKKRIDAGTHNFLGPESNKKRIDAGTHNLMGGVTCRDRSGAVIQIPKEVYHKQKEVTSDMTQWEFVMINSKIAKIRKNNVL